VLLSCVRERRHGSTEWFRCASHRLDALALADLSAARRLVTAAYGSQTQVDGSSQLAIV
jgi:hypothetical protein